MRKLITASIVLNGMALVVFLGSWAYARVILPTATSRYVTAMDRAGVFCEEKLRTFDPALADNVRHNAGPFITQDYRKAIMFLVTVGVGINAITLVMLVRLRRMFPQSRGPAPEDGNDADVRDDAKPGRHRG